jgi:hypothetical protein
MASSNSEKINENLYAVLGLKKECSKTELRSAYKKLALVSFLIFEICLFRFCSLKYRTMIVSVSLIWSICM